MERQIIESAVATLPYSELGEVQADHEIWEEIDGGASIKVTRHYLPTPNKDPIISLSVSGIPSERERVLSEFTEVFGEPTQFLEEPEQRNFVCIALWVNIA